MSTHATAGLVVIDAGPALNFFSINKERVLLDVLGPITAPETVAEEVKQKARTDRRFETAATVWTKLAGTRWLEVLSDDTTPELSEAVQRMCYLPMEDRLQRAQDLGEVMVLAHAAVGASNGKSVIVLLDDGAGVQRAGAEIARLKRLRSQGKSVGSIQLVNTVTVLERAAGRA